jgi:hypothetical protein
MAYLSKTLALSSKKGNKFVHKNGKFKLQINLDRLGPRPLPNI